MRVRVGVRVAEDLRVSDEGEGEEGEGEEGEGEDEGEVPRVKCEARRGQRGKARAHLG